MHPKSTHAHTPDRSEAPTQPTTTFPLEHDHAPDASMSLRRCGHHAKPSSGLTDCVCLFLCGAPARSNMSGGGVQGPQGPEGRRLSTPAPAQGFTGLPGTKVQGCQKPQGLRSPRFKSLKSQDSQGSQVQVSGLQGSKAPNSSPNPMSFVFNCHGMGPTRLHKGSNQTVVLAARPGPSLSPSSSWAVCRPVAPAAPGARRPRPATKHNNQNNTLCACA